MVLRDHFEQRVVEATYGSFRSLVPLRTPSGPQWTESELETELLEQLAFAPFVCDLITQPIIHYTLEGQPRRYTPDIAMQLDATGDDLPSRYIIEVKRQEDLRRDAARHAIRFEVGRICAEETGAVFRVMDESRIRTPYLGNARRLAHQLLTELTDHEEDALDFIRRNGPQSVTEVLARLAGWGFAEPDARHIVEHSVARRYLSADLAVPFSDESLIMPYPRDVLAAVRCDPILRLLQDAPDGANI
ncbi:MAG: TnsA endonuclease N-terminal domain-containing protein [Sphingomonas sp.]